MNTVTVTATQARIDFFELINAAKHAGQITLITKNGKVAAKITPADTQTNINAKKLEAQKLLESVAGIFTDDDVRAAKKFRDSFNQHIASSK